MKICNRCNKDKDTNGFPIDRTITIGSIQQMDFSDLDEVDLCEDCFEHLMIYEFKIWREE